MITEPEIDQHVAKGVASLTELGVSVFYCPVTGGDVHVSGHEGRGEKVQILTEKLARELVICRRLTEELHRWLNRN